MLTCLPKSLCSRDFRILGASEEAVVSFNALTEQGSISLGAAEYAIRKHGLMSGRWSLVYEGQTVAEARKPRAMSRSIDVQVAGEQFKLQPQSAFTRAFDLFLEGQAVGVIRPAHAFTRRAFVECRSPLPEEVQLFLFWLAALMWRRDEDTAMASSTSSPTAVST